jgi:hypothetical protein
MRLRLLIAVAALLAPSADAARLVLKRKFVEVHKNRATLDAQFIVDHAKKTVNPISSGGKDGDLHIAGRAQKEVGLPMVAEIVNAKEQQAAIAKVREAEDSGKPVRMSGVWRIWFEHPGKVEHIQGNPVAKPANTNPDHVFELHPVSGVGGVSLISSFKWIPGYKAYTADRSFPEYEKLTATVRATKTSITIDSRNAGYNYSEFNALISGQPKTFDDCVIANATILDENDPENKPASGLRRLVFLKGMAGLDQVKKGAEVRILGIPRLNLERLLDMIQGQEGKTLTNVKLHYEFIVVGIAKPK